jgi:protein TonB
MAARAARIAAPRRGALGASLALHGAVAAAAVLPFLRPEPIGPAAPGAVEMVWLSPGPRAEAEAEAPAQMLVETAPLPEPEAALLPALAEPAPTPEAPLPEAPPLDIAAAVPPEPAVEAAPPEPAEAAPAPPPPAPVRTAARPPEPQPRPVPRPAPRVESRPRTVTRPATSEATTGAPALGVPGAVATQPAPPASAPPGSVLVTTPRYRSPPTPPAYPPRAVEFGLTGTVLVRARVSPDGSTEETRIWRSSGHPLLDAAATAAVRRWAFEPASVDGRRVEAWVEVPVHFRLN